MVYTRGRMKGGHEGFVRDGDGGHTRRAFKDLKPRLKLPHGNCAHCHSMYSMLLLNGHVVVVARDCLGQLLRGCSWQGSSIL